jgi:hypothetical protein
MKAKSVIIAEPRNQEQLNVLKAFMNALKIEFKVAEKSEYNPEFVEKVLESQKQAASGKVTRVKKEDIKEFLGL